MKYKQQTGTDKLWYIKKKKISPYKSYSNALCMSDFLHGS